MDLELHQIALPYAPLRIASASRAAHLLASLAELGQQTPVLVVSRDDGSYVLIDGYARVGALRALGRDTALATVLAMPEPEALLLAFRLEVRQPRSPLEQGWLVAELSDRHGWSQRQIGQRLQRSASWVCRRLALVRELPEPVQAAVRRGLVPPHAAEKYLAPLARANAEQCARLVGALGSDGLSVRQVERLYVGWKAGDAEVRERIVTRPRLYLDAERAAGGRPERADDPAAPLLADLDALAGIARRARRRVDEELLGELDGARRRRLGRARSVARTVCEDLFTGLEEACSTSTPAPRS